MPTSFPLTSDSVVHDADSAWAQIEHAIGESSVMRCEGRAEEAAAMLQEQLPPLIRAWSENSGRSADECRDELRQLFAKAQAQVADAMFTRRLVLASIQAQPAALRQDQPEAGDRRLHLRRRIPIDDVVGMLDALSEATRPTPRAQTKTFVSSSSRPAAAVEAGPNKKTLTAQPR